MKGTYDQNELAASIRRFNSAVKSFLDVVAIVTFTTGALMGAIYVAMVVYALVPPIATALWQRATAPPFDPVEWARAPDDERGWMVRDLVERVLPGKTEPEITALLGPPEPDPGRDPHPAVWWWAGLEPKVLFRWHFNCVVVDFTASDVATPETISVLECG